MSLKKLFNHSAIFLSFLSVCYGVLWGYSVQKINNEIENAYIRAQRQGVEFLGPVPRIVGFPLIPEMVYTKGIKAGETEILFPEMRLRGFPIPSFPLDIKFPKGLAIGGVADPSILKADWFYAKVMMPTHLPQHLYAEDLAAWHDRGGKIDIKFFSLRSGKAILSGKGLLSIDEALQPIVALDSRLTGYQPFILDLADRGLVERIPAALAITVFNSMAKADESATEPGISLSINLKNRILSLGPIQAVQIPPFVWDRRTPPAPPL